MSDATLATIIMSVPFLALCIVFFVADAYATRAELARLRELRVIARREGR